MIELKCLIFHINIKLVFKYLKFIIINKKFIKNYLTFCIFYCYYSVMEYRDIVLDVLGSKSKVKILGYLINNEGCFSANQISNAIKMTPRTVLLTMDEFIKLNIITYSKKKKDKVYKINNNNWIVKEKLRKLFNSEDYFFEIEDCIKKHLKDYLSDISSIIRNNNEIIIVFKEDINEYQINEFKSLVKKYFEVIIKNKFSINLNFKIYSIYSVLRINDLNEPVTIFGEPLDLLEAKKIINKNKIEKVKEFFGV